MMQRLSKLVPAIIVLLLTLAAALPLGAPVEARLALMLLPLIAIAHFACVRGAGVPAPLAFGCGLVLDVLTHGPLGFWAGLNTAAQLLAAALAPVAGDKAVARAGVVLLVTSVMASAGALVAWLGFEAALTLRTVAQAGAGALAVYLAAVGASAMAARPTSGGATFQLQRQRSR